jgi:hypothetical protein
MWRLALAGLALVLTPALASARSFGVEAFAAFNTHSMASWNTDLELANEAGGDFNRLGPSFGGGAGVRCVLNETWSLDADWEPLSVESKDAPTGRALVFEAQTYHLGVVRNVRATRMSRLGFGGSVGWYELRGRRENAGVQTASLSGHTLGFIARATGEHDLGRGIAATATVGYRYAKIADTQVNGASFNPRIETDWSGLVVRLGLTFQLWERSTSELRSRP